MIDYIKKRWKVLLAIVTSLLYILLMSRFYLIDYDVPDYTLYLTLAQENSPARDGFSSLFIQIMKLGINNFYTLHIFSLVSLGFGIFSLLYFFETIFSPNYKRYIIGIVGVLSSGIWYYFYGKLVYDFPFTILTYGFCLILLSKFIRNNNIKYWYGLFILMGLCLSWKPYNIFLITGICGIMVTSETIRAKIWNKLNSFKEWIKIMIVFCIGYLIGNFNLIFKPYRTLKGIAAYPAKYNFNDFIFNNSRIVWDHINSLSFNSTTYLIFSSIIILFIVPTIQKKIWYPFLSAFLIVCMYIYIERFSPGYPWHGFSVGGYTLTLLLVIVGEMDSIKMKKNKICMFMIVFAILIQLIHNFGFYIPKQYKWFSTTNKAIELFEEDSSKILDEVEEITKNLDGDYTIDFAVKRFKTTGTHFKIDALQVGNLNGWSELYKTANMDSNNIDTKYIITIVPNSFYIIDDVTNVHKYDNKKILMRKSFDKYQINLYLN